MTKPPKDIGVSVRARLLRLARERGEDFQLLLLRYANERLLYRLANAPAAASRLRGLAVGAGTGGGLNGRAPCARKPSNHAADEDRGAAAGRAPG